MKRVNIRISIFRIPLANSRSVCFHRVLFHCFILSTFLKPFSLFSDTDKGKDEEIMLKSEKVERSKRLGLIVGYETIAAELAIQESGNKLLYKSSGLSRYNLGAEWKGFAGSVSVSANSNDELESGDVNTSGFALILQGAKGPIGWVGSYYNISGFNMETVNGVKPAAGSRGRDDIRLINVGINVFYSLFHEDFSPAAAFRYLDKQSFSGWSPILEVSYDTFAVSAAKSLVPEDKVDLFKNSSAFTGSMSTSLNFYAGVAGIWAVTQNFYVAASISAGTGPELSRTSSSDGEITATSLTTKSSGRFGLGYKTGDHAIGANSFNDNILSSHENYKTVFSKFSSEIFYAHLTDWSF